MKKNKNAYRSNNNDAPFPRSGPMSDGDADLMSLEHRARQSFTPERALIRFSLEDQAFQLDPRALRQLPELRAITEALARFEIEAEDLTFLGLRSGLDKGKLTRSAKSSIQFKLRCPVGAVREVIAVLEHRKDTAVAGFSPDPAPAAARSELTRRCLSEFRAEAEARAEALGLAVLGFHRLTCTVNEAGSSLAANDSGYFSSFKTRGNDELGWQSSLTLIACARGEVILSRFSPDAPAEP